MPCGAVLAADDRLFAASLSRPSEQHKILLSLRLFSELDSDLRACCIESEVSHPEKLF